MSNPTFKTGPISFEVADAVTKFSVVTLAAGGVSPCGAADVPFGAVATSGAPDVPREPNDLQHGLPSHVAVHSAGAALPLRIDGAVEVGATVYAAADGAVSATGTNPVGVVVRAATGDTDKTAVVLLTCPNPAASA